jgi:class 3 adenylate cyclase/tetratricopeptide (TPR) repeat protein
MSVSRRIVSVLFCDVVGSTPLGERLDPEALREVMGRYYGEVRAALERHGGTVEKFIGDAIMAVFGIPTLHEDDALRAVRAASDLRLVAARLDEELVEEFGVGLQIRIGVATGEVLAGDPSGGQSFATGEPVVLAQRLETSARPGEILIGDGTYSATAGALVAEPVEALHVKGKAESVRAWRLLGVLAGAEVVPRRFDTPLVGRTVELAQLRAAFGEARTERACRVVTLLGPPGVGKSRLLHELEGSLGSAARVLTGRCLHYGDGITYWPVRELVQRAFGLHGREPEAEVRARLLAGLGDVEGAELVVDRVAGLLHRGGEPRPPAETFWGVRRLLESLARDTPLVLVLEDVHWAEPTLLDLVEYLMARTAGPLLLICVARPELLDLRPAWPVSGPSARAILLEPLGDEESRRLASGLGVPAEAVERVVVTAEGNPLFLEEFARMVLEEGVDAGTVPPTIQALLAARVDHLGAEERGLLQRAAVVGKSFSWRALAGLAPEAAGGSQLQTLVRKRLIEPEPAAGQGEDAFRFGHVLIRDAAYGALPKRLRAELHERHAGWLEAGEGERLADVEEIVGYHLEAAALALRDISPYDPKAAALAARAGEQLASAGRRAFARDDVPAAVSLLGRAEALLGDAAGGELLLELGNALAKTGEFAHAEEAFARAAKSPDRRLQLRAEIEIQTLRSFAAPAGAAAEDARVAERAIPELEELGDDYGLAKAWRLLSEAHVIASRWQARADALERALTHARRVPEARRDASTIAMLLAQALHYGPTPAPTAIARCRELLRDAETDDGLRAGVTATLAALVAMQGDFEQARSLYGESTALLDELGLRFRRAVRSLVGAEIESLAGDLAAAERELRSGYEALEAIGERGVRAVLAAFLADVLCEQGIDEKAERFAGIAAEIVEPSDLVPHALQRAVRARVLARRGDEAAEALAHEAVELANRTDFPGLRARTLVALAEVVPSRGAESIEEAIRLYEEKGNVAAANQLARGLLTPPPPL